MRFRFCFDFCSISFRFFFSFFSRCFPCFVVFFFCGLVLYLVRASTRFVRTSTRLRVHLLLLKSQKRTQLLELACCRRASIASTAQHSTAQHSTAQPYTKQHSTFVPIRARQRKKPDRVGASMSSSIYTSTARSYSFFFRGPFFTRITRGSYVPAHVYFCTWFCSNHKSAPSS